MGFKHAKARTCAFTLIGLCVVLYVAIYYSLDAQKNSRWPNRTSTASWESSAAPGCLNGNDTARPESSATSGRSSTTSTARPWSTTSKAPIDAVRGNFLVDSRPARAYNPVGPFLLPCDWTPESLVLPTRQEAFLSCGSRNSSSSSSSSPWSSSPSSSSLNSSSLSESYGLPFVSFRSVPADVVPSIASVIREEDKKCLSRLIQERCVDKGRKVPRLAHYVRFGERFDFPLDAFVSILSVARFLRPCLILLHGDVVPSGRYWRALLQLVPNVLHVPLVRPRTIFNRTINVIEHAADVARLQVLLQYGGVYLDMDHLVLRSLDALLNQSMVIGTEVKGHQCGNGFLVAEPRARFLELWMANYTDFDDKQWATHSTVRPQMLSEDYPHLVHVVDTFFTPNYAGMKALFSRTDTAAYNWHSHYGMHLYSRMHRQPLFSRPDRIDYQDNVVGEVVRHVMYGDQHACWDKKRGQFL